MTEKELTDLEEMEQCAQKLIAGIRSGHIKAFCAVALTGDTEINEFYSFLMGKHEAKVDKKRASRAIGDRTVRMLGMLEVMKDNLLNQIDIGGDIDDARGPKGIP